MTTLVFDETAGLLANLMPPEFHDVSLEKKRFFIPSEGMFYEEGMVLRNFANNALLRPILDYMLYEIDREVTIATGHAAYKIIHISNPDVVAITVAYQAVGGDYQYTPTQLAAELAAYITGPSEQYPWGNVILRPISYAPELHLQDVDTIYDAQRLVLSVENIGESIVGGDKLASGQIYQYMDQLAQQYVDDATAQLAGIESRVDAIIGAAELDIGQFIITDNPQNPAIRRGVGQYQLNPDILLYGASLSDTIGSLVSVAT